MARLWKWGIVLFLLIGLLTHHEESMIQSIMETPYEAFQLVFTVVLSACLWGGFLNIIKKTGFMCYFSFLLRPLLRLIYGSVINEKNLYEELSSNIIANLLGLGSLATMSGLQAFKHMNQMNTHPSYPSKEMLTLVIVNTAGFSLFPSSLIMIRKQFSSTHLYAFYPYMIMISLSIIIIGLIVQRLIDHE